MAAKEEINDEMLIELVKNSPHLYDQNLPSFKDKEKRFNSWNLIAEELGCSGRFVGLFFHLCNGFNTVLIKLQML